jgi:hypothetical protein
MGQGAKIGCREGRCALAWLPWALSRSDPRCFLPVPSRNVAISDSTPAAPPRCEHRGHTIDCSCFFLLLLSSPPTK